MSQQRRPESRVVETRSGRYRVAWIPIQASPIPGWTACHIQAVPTNDPTRAVRLTLFERAGGGPQRDPGSGSQAA